MGTPPGGAGLVWFVVVGRIWMWSGRGLDVGGVVGMALGRRQTERQGELWVSAEHLPRSIGHAFYDTLNRLLLESGFGRFAEELCAPCYADSRGRPSIPPGTYFRMFLVGYFEGIESPLSPVENGGAFLGRMAALGLGGGIER